MNAVLKELLEHLALFFQFGANNISMAIQEVKCFLVLFSILADDIKNEIRQYDHLLRLPTFWSDNPYNLENTEKSVVPRRFA